MDQREASTDWISDLPSNVIDNIMLYLPLLDAARMSVLSKKWRSNWVSLPYLVFDYKFAKTVLANDDYNAYKWFSIISNILLLHEGSIIEFSLTIPCSISSLYPDISPWISLVSSKGVKTLAIMNEGEPLIALPSQLFFCAGLEDLTLHSCTMDPLPCFTGFRNLLSLDLCDVVFEDVTFRDFMACCPVLETLRVTGCRIHDPIVIDSPNLKNLTFIGAYECISFKNAPNLLLLSLYLVVDLEIIEGAVDMIKFLVSSCKLQRLCLFSEACEVLANSGISTILPTTFKQLKILKLSIAEDHMDGFLCGFGIVRSCLNIKELEIRLSMYQRSPSKEELNNFTGRVLHPWYFTSRNKEGLSGVLYLVNMMHNYVKVKEHGETESLELEHFDNDPECAFNHLCKIYIRRMGLISVELKLVSYLLAFSPLLVRLSFTCKSNLNAAAKSQLHRQMLQFKRASPKAEIVKLNCEV